MLRPVNRCGYIRASLGGKITITTVTIYFIHPRLREIGKAVVRAYTFVQGRTELHIIISIIQSHETHTLTYTLLDMTLCLSQSTYTKAYAKQNLNLNHAHVSSSILSGFFMINALIQSLTVTYVILHDKISLSICFDCQS